jgi:hypothetical protein
MAGVDRQGAAVELHKADIALVQRMKGDSHFRYDGFDISLALSFADDHLRAPREELGIAFDVSYDGIHLLRRVRKNARFLMKRHERKSAASRQARGPKLREVFAGMIGGPRERARGDHQEAFGARDLLESLELVRLPETRDGGMFAAGLQILADGEEIDMGAACKSSITA